MVKVRPSIILIEDNQVLLIRHNSATRNKQSFFRLPASKTKQYWVFPGGEVRQGETLIDCAKRETFEETGLEVEIGPLLFFGETIWPSGERHVINFFFEAQRIRGEVTKPNWSYPDEALDIPEFVPISQCDKFPLYPGIISQLLEIAEGKLYKGVYLGNLWIEK